MKKQEKKNFDLPKRGFEPQISSNFEFSWKVRVMRSNLGKEVKISRLYAPDKRPNGLTFRVTFNKEKEQKPIFSACTC